MRTDAALGGFLAVHTYCIFGFILLSGPERSKVTEAW